MHQISPVENFCSREGYACVMSLKTQNPTWMGGKGVLGAGAGAACIAGKSFRGSTAMLKLRASERSSGFAAPAAADSRSLALLAAQPSSLPNREALLCSCIKCHTLMQSRGDIDSYLESVFKSLEKRRQFMTRFVSYSPFLAKSKRSPRLSWYSYCKLWTIIKSANC